MFGLFRKKKQYPAFDLLFASELKNKYFIRSAEWDLLTEDSIFVFDPNSPGMFTLDQWPQLVFLAAKGQMTVQEYVYYAADKYDTEVPQMLDKTILDQIQTLLEYKIIRLADSSLILYMKCLNQEGATAANSGFLLSASFFFAGI